MIATTKSWTIKIPNFLPLSLNRLMRMHWARRNKDLKAEYFLIWVYCNVAEIPRAMGKRRVSLVLTLGPRNKMRDFDNCWKSTLDGLTKAGMLIDDSPRWIEQGPVEYVRGREKATTIVLEEME